MHTVNVTIVLPCVGISKLLLPPLLAAGDVNL